MPMRQVTEWRHKSSSVLVTMHPPPHILISWKSALAGEGNPEVEKILEQFGFVRGVGYLQNFGKTGDMALAQKAADAFGKFAEKYPQNENAVNVQCSRATTCLRALQNLPEAAAVIGDSLDENQPYKKKIVKRSELFKLIPWESSVLSYHSQKTG